jgi:hypothetical protein
MSIKMQRIKMRQLRNISDEMFGPRKKLDGKQLEAKMKASKAARVTHQILKWTDLINKQLNWRVADILARQVETELNGGRPVAIRNHDKCCEKQKACLIKYMHALKSLIAPFDPDAPASYGDDEEAVNEDEGDQPIRLTGAKFISREERVQKICDSSLPGPVKLMDLLTEEQRRERESERQNRLEELHSKPF